MAVIPVNSFITLVTNSQLQKKGAGGRRTYWDPNEMREMKLLANQVVVGNYSASQLVRMYKDQRSKGNTIGSLRANKSPTAFKKKLNSLVQQMRAENERNNS